MHSLSTFGARTSHGQTRTHKTHHGSNLGEATTFPLIVYYVPFHEAHIQMAFCLGTPKWESWNSHNYDYRNFGGPITLRTTFWLGWSLKQSCSPCQELFKNMLHAPFPRGNWDDSQLLMVENQIANLTPSPSFGHNLCFKCSNRSCKHILDIQFLKDFQWFKERLNPLSFDLWNCSLKIQ